MGRHSLARGNDRWPGEHRHLLRFSIGGSEFQCEATEAWAIGNVEVVSDFIRSLSFRCKGLLIIFLHPNLIDPVLEVDSKRQIYSVAIINNESGISSLFSTTFRV